MRNYTALFFYILGGWREGRGNYLLPCQSVASMIGIAEMKVVSWHGDESSFHHYVVGFLWIKKLSRTEVTY